MSSKLNVCKECEYRNINKPSVVWCSKCDEWLCMECKKHHAASKVSRNHNIVSLSEYQKLISSILINTKVCPKHNEKYQRFCKKHDTPYCRRCVVEAHNNCKELNAIDDVIQSVKSSNAFLEMDQMLAEVSENLQRIRNDRQENISSMERDRATIEREIQQTRISINRYLDKLQNGLVKELYTAEEKEKKNINNLISPIQKKESEITECKNTLDIIRHHVSDLETFLTLKHIQRDVTNNEQFLESLLQKDRMNCVSISWKSDKALETLSTTIYKIGNIILKVRSSDVTLANRNNEKAQTIVPIRIEARSSYANRKKNIHG
ncbi:unnamed protein product [Mytilus coruscus]|uniref:B box-type domain-containing protein n=1 Tax=Mytilus coruscus TaxID=42192 RepID=A0A6J8E8X3_MYTCO|nr:unnamed protein product [Mytilus coruscus]